jgi:hypothetical protein
VLVNAPETRPAHAGDRAEFLPQRPNHAYDCLAAAGYRYSSSIYPIRHDHYGAPDAPRFPYDTKTGLIEVPITTARFMRKNWPAGGGGYFRLMPYAVSRWLIQHVNENDGEAAILLHPWRSIPSSRGKEVGQGAFSPINLRRTAGGWTAARDFR